MLTADWDNEIQPLLQKQPESDLEILFWVFLMRETERELEFMNIPSGMAHILRLGQDRLPELISESTRANDQPGHSQEGEVPLDGTKKDTPLGNDASPLPNGGGLGSIITTI